MNALKQTPLPLPALLCTLTWQYPKPMKDFFPKDQIALLPFLTTLRSTLVLNGCLGMLFPSLEYHT